MTRNIYLEGDIGDRFVKSFSMNTVSFPEVFRCLECNYPNFRNYLIECCENNIGFVCEVAGKPLETEKELLLEYREGDMIITALPAGSKSGGAKILAAIAIVVITAGIGGFSFAGNSMISFGQALAATGTPGLIALSLATNLALTGINQIMAPDPSVDNDQDESYLFQGTGQTLIEGDPVPVLYGKLRVPGRPISLQVRNERSNYIDYGTTYADSTADAVNPKIVVPPGGGGPPAEDTEHEQMR